MKVSAFNWEKYSRSESNSAQAHRLIMAFGDVEMSVLLDKPDRELSRGYRVGVKTLAILNRIDYMDVM